MKNDYFYAAKNYKSISKVEKCNKIKIMKFKEITLKDVSSKSITRTFLNSYDDVFVWINDKFKEQKRDGKPKCIDLSYVIIDIYDKTANSGKGLHSNFNIDSLVNHIDNINVFSSIDDSPYEVKYPIIFDFSIIYEANFCNTKFVGSVSFDSTQFLGGVIFSESTFLSPVDFQNIHFNKIFSETMQLGYYPIGNVMFDHIVFKKNVYFLDLNWVDVIRCVYFNHNTYEGIVEFKRCFIDSPQGGFFNFSESTFKMDVLFIGELGKIGDYRMSNIDLGSSYFCEKLKIRGYVLGDIRMGNCHFNNTVSIVYNLYNEYSELDFSFSTIKSLFIIDSDIGNQIGENINLTKSISFRKALIKNEAFVFLRNINYSDGLKHDGEINFEYSNILGTIAIQDTRLRNLKFNKATVVGNLNIEDVEVLRYDCRETITKIKNEFIKKNDTINALKYKAIEVQYYKRELETDILEKISFILNWKFVIAIKVMATLIIIIPLCLTVFFVGMSIYSIIGCLILLVSIWMPILKWINWLCEKINLLIQLLRHIHLSEYVLLCLNTVSNKNGLSWKRGIIFTMITAMIFFFMINYWGIESDGRMFYIDWRFNNFGEVWKNYLSLINLINFNDKFDGFRLNDCGETLFFMSKLFVGYGIYQTISAFRKYGNK